MDFPPDCATGTAPSGWKPGGAVLADRSSLSIPAETSQVFVLPVSGARYHFRIKGLMPERYLRASQCASFQNTTWSMRRNVRAVKSANL